jgi:hypothetical protein
MSSPNNGNGREFLTTSAKTVRIIQNPATGALPNYFRVFFMQPKSNLDSS